MVSMSPEQALAALPNSLRGSSVAMPSESEANDFMEKVDEVTRLIEGLREGTLPPSYVDSKMQAKEDAERKERETAKKVKEEAEQKISPEREEQLKQRAEELKASYYRKQ
eukprot:scaffold142433_cov43-Prasinocladus_malaysianus.AAC.1